jgi:hypothetical protein
MVCYSSYFVYRETLYEWSRLRRYLLKDLLKKLTKWMEPHFSALFRARES